MNDVLIFVVTLTFTLGLTVATTTIPEKKIIIVHVGTFETSLWAYEIQSITHLRQMEPALHHSPGLPLLLMSTEQQAEFHQVVTNLSRLALNLQEQIGSESVYVYGTAASRQLSSPLRRQLLETLEVRLGTPHVRVMSGEEEAAFGVLSLISQPEKVQTQVHMDPRWGWLEMEASSLQIAWLTDDMIYEHFFALPPILAPFGNANIFARSFPELGWQSFLDARMRFLSTNNTKSLCTSQASQSGRSDMFDACRTLTLDIVDFPSWYVYRQPTPIPSVFVATAGLAHIVRNVLNINASLVSAKDIEIATRHACFQEGASVTCVQGVLAYVVLVDLFHLFEPNVTLQYWIHSPDTNQSVGWPRGAALYRNWQVVSHTYFQDLGSKSLISPWLINLIIAMVLLFLFLSVFFLVRIYWRFGLFAAQGESVVCCKCCDRRQMRRQQLARQRQRLEEDEKKDRKPLLPSNQPSADTNHESKLQEEIQLVIAEGGETGDSNNDNNTSGTEKSN